MLIGIIAGPTAIGKSGLALQLAERNGFALINGDSRQIYRGLQVGTAAPTEAEQKRAPHHLFQCLDPRAAFSPKLYREAVLRVLAEEPRPALLVGGSGLYIRELLCPSPKDRGETPQGVRDEAAKRLSAEGWPAVHAWLAALDPQGLAKVHPQDGYRLQKRLEHHLWKGDAYADYQASERDPQFASVPVFLLECPRAELHARIEERLGAMWRAGWVDEVRFLMARYGPGAPALTAVGYSEIAAWLASREGRGVLDPGVIKPGPPESESELKQRLLAKTRQYAKKQIAFFRSQIPGIQTWSRQALISVLQGYAWDWPVFMNSRGESASKSN